MTSRTVLPQIDQVISVSSASPYELARGLSDGQTVRVIADGNAGVTVSADSGQEFRVAIQCCDMPHEYLLEERWAPESHPAVLENLIAMIVELETTRQHWPKGIERCNEANLERWRNILREHMR